MIPSGSMELTLNGNNGTGDRILVDKVVYDFHSPRPGDVVVFKGPPGWDQTEFFVDTTTNPMIKWLRQFASDVGIAKPNEYDLVKRVIAVGGQTVMCCDAQNRVIVDGKALDEPYIYWQPGRPGPAEQLRFGADHASRTATCGSRATTGATPTTRATRTAAASTASCRWPT